MEDDQFREAELEEQKSLPFKFDAPCLQLSQDKSEGRIFWKSEGQIIADHKQQMVNNIRTDNKTQLNSSWMVPTDAQRNLQTLLADLGKGTSWLNMYKMTAKACEAIQPLPHNFAMPKVEPACPLHPGGTGGRVLGHRGPWAGVRSHFGPRPLLAPTPSRRTADPRPP